jgi:hypothetical protein
VAELRLTSEDHLLSLLSWGDPEALAVCLAAPLLAGARVSFLTPGGEIDIATAIAQHDVSMLAGRWHTASGVRVTAARVAQGVPALRDGLLYRDER